MSKLEIAVLIGAEGKEWLANLTTQINRLEGLTIATPKETAVATTPPKTAKATGKATKVAAPKEEDETFDLGDDEAEEAPVITKKDLIAACKENREAAVKILKKLKVASIHDLAPTQYQTVLSAVGV